jgi:hypothetical protein
MGAMDENPYRAPKEEGTKLSEPSRFVQGVWFAAALAIANLAVCGLWMIYVAMTPWGMAWWHILAPVAMMAAVSFGLAAIMRRNRPT